MRIFTAVGTAIVAACVIGMHAPAHLAPRVCEHGDCRPASEFWGGPRDWPTPWGTVGPHQF